MPVLNLTNDEADVLYMVLNMAGAEIADAVADGYMHPIDRKALLIKLDMIRPANPVGWREGVTR